MKVLALPRYERMGASSRVRFHQYLPAVRAVGLQIQVAPLFSDSYVHNLQRGHRAMGDVAGAYLRRARVLRQMTNVDLLWIEKDALPWLPARLEVALLSDSIPYVLDYDDAVFHSYDQHRKQWIRRLLAGKHPELMRGAALVVAGNEYLANFARAAGARRVELVPTVIDLERYPAPVAGRTATDSIPTVGWIGQRATASLIRPLAPLFQMLTESGWARFKAVGIDAAALGLPMDSLPWSEASEVTAVSGFDIGIMPLVDEPFERGKCGYKLIQYMACGLPVVASPVGVNCQIVEHGVNGFLAESPSQWQEALQTLLADPELRQRMGQAGRQKIEQQYCLQVTGPKLAAMLLAAAGACAI